MIVMAILFIMKMEIIYIPYDTHDGSRYTQDPCNEVYNDFWGSTAFNLDRTETGVDYNDVQDDFNNALNAWQNLCNGCTLNNQYICSIALLLYLGHKINMNFQSVVGMQVK